MRYLGALFFLLLLLILPPSLYGSDQVINILYTGNMEGEIGPCGCAPKTDFGGVARFAKYIAENEKELSPYILVDAGNFSGDNSPQGKLKTETMLRAFNVIGYDVIALQDRERKLPGDFMATILGETDLPVISDTGPGKGSLTLDRNGFNINISMDKEAHRKGSLNILLVNELPSSRTFNKWDIIIMASEEIVEEPRKEGNSITVSGYPKGKRLGVLSLRLLDNGKIKDYNHRWEMLGSDYEADKRIRALIDEYDARVARLLKDREEPLPGTSYIGAEKCAQCHQPFMESWRSTRHANAFASLERVGKTKDPECIACHSVGFGEKGGFYNIETTPSLANVQCESCHGLNREHIEDYTIPMKRITEEKCLKCHTPENSPEFNYSKYLELIKH
jgi:hypothetical protein